MFISAALFLLSVCSAHDAKASSKWIADDEQRLVNFLFENYSNVIRPVENKRHPVPVEMGLALAQIIDLVRYPRPVHCGLTTRRVWW